jgi:hypothetical protein
MRVPAAGLQINFHVAGHGLFIFKLQNGTAKIRPAFDADETGVQHADASSVRRFEPVAVEALVLPDGLEQFFRRHGSAVAQHVDGAAAFTPDGVEIVRTGMHPAVFCAAGGEVKLF